MAPVSRTIAVANQKGGVAKTTTVASLGSALAERGHKVLLVDLDPQSCLTFSLGLDPEAVELSVHDVLLGRVGASMAILPTEDGVDLLPATIELAGAEAQLMSRPGREYVLRSALEEVDAAYDVVLLDCSPSLGVLTLNALTAADELIIPLQCEMLSHRGVGQLLDTVADVQRILNPACRSSASCRPCSTAAPTTPAPCSPTCPAATAAGAGAADPEVGAVRRGSGRRALGAGHRSAGPRQRGLPRAGRGAVPMSAQEPGFDRLRRRGTTASQKVPLRVDPQGRQSLYSVSEQRRPRPAR